MRKLFRTFIARLPLQFRVLYRQFFLRVVDLEALSIEADIPRFLGQFAGVLIFVSLMQAVGTLWFPPPVSFAWHVEQSAVANTMLVVGLISVLTWDSTFPDRRDAMVLGPLPVNPRIILVAKLAASAMLLGLAVVCLNFASSVAFSLLFAGPQGAGAFLRFLAAYWFTLIVASVFLYGSVLAIQGLTALLLPRRIFLRVSALLQLAAFGLFLSVYFLAPTIDTPAELSGVHLHSRMTALPVLWFFGLLNQCTGSLPPEALWLARRGWIALTSAVIGATASLLVCYLRTMRKTVEEPDLVPARRGLRWNPRFGGALQSAVSTFILRSLLRSRQHRVILVLFLAIVCACALQLVHLAPGIGLAVPLPSDFVVLTVWMMVFAVMGFRAIFPLPVSLTANWILRITQIRPPEDYIAAVHRSLLALAVVPVWIVSAVLSLSYRPVSQVAAHLALLLLLGAILVEIALIGFYKIPFTCSHTPGKSNFQFVFWGCMVGVMMMLLFVLEIEIPALRHSANRALLLLAFLVLAACLHLMNRKNARSAILYFEEPPTEVITRLGLLSVLPAASDASDNR